MRFFLDSEAAEKLYLMSCWIYHVTEISVLWGSNIWKFESPPPIHFYMCVLFRIGGRWITLHNLSQPTTLNAVTSIQLDIIPDLWEEAENPHRSRIHRREAVITPLLIRQGKECWQPVTYTLIRLWVPRGRIPSHLNLDQLVTSHTSQDWQIIIGLWGITGTPCENHHPSTLVYWFNDQGSNSIHQKSTDQVLVHVIFWKPFVVYHFFN